MEATYVSDEVIELGKQAQFGALCAIGTFANYFYFMEKKRVEGKRFFSFFSLFANIFVGWWFGLVLGNMIRATPSKTGIVMLAGFYLHPILATLEITVVDKVSKYFTGNKVTPIEPEKEDKK